MQIQTIKHSGLKRLVTRNDRSRLPATYIEQIFAQLRAIEAATDIGELLSYPYGRWHALKGNRNGIYAGYISKNWRMTFRYLPDERAVEILDLEDYH